MSYGRTGRFYRNRFHFFIKLPYLESSSATMLKRTSKSSEEPYLYLLQKNVWFSLF